MGHVEKSTGLQDKTKERHSLLWLTETETFRPVLLEIREHLQLLYCTE
jgi:hypothetical protein